MLWLVIALPVVHALFIYPGLPEEMPVHFTNGHADRYAEKSFFYLIIVPITNASLHFIISYVTKFDQQKKVVDRFSFFLFRLSLAGSLSVLALLVNYQIANPNTDMNLQPWAFSSFVVFLCFGAYLIACLGPSGINLSLSEKMRQPEVWEKVRRGMLKILPVSAIISLFLIWILPEDAVPIFLIIGTPCILLLPLLYAYYITGEVYNLKR